MSNHFMSIIAGASESKAKFDSSMTDLKADLKQSIENASEIQIAPAPKTGWLKGSLSYPWVLVCSIVPTLKEIF